MFVFIAYTHINEDGTVLDAKLVHRPCNARITTYQPIDRDDHRIIVLVENAHSHPIFPMRKVTLEGRRKYAEAAKAHGTVGLSVVKCDNGEE